VTSGLGGYPIGLANGFESIWAVVRAGSSDRALVRIDPRSNRVVARLELPPNGGLIPDVEVAAGAVWVTDFDHLLRVQPAPLTPAADGACCAEAARTRP
jgi:hypothetical protein